MALLAGRTAVVTGGAQGLGYAIAEQWLAATRALIAECSCQHGCPSCVQSPKCGNGNEPLDASGAVQLLDLLLAGARTAPQD